MKISFVIPAYNEERVIGACLTSLLEAIDRTPCDSEIIVVNNASTDTTRVVAERYKDVRVVDQPRKGLVWARKAGFDASHGDIIANVDADTVFPKEWLPKVLKEFTNDPELLALSGPYIYHDAPWSIRFFTRLFYILGYLFDRLTHFLFESGAMLQGGNFVLRRSALEQIGGFDTSIEFYGEDSDIGRRVRQIGKVKWTFGLPMYSSGRRFMQQGLLKIGILYTLNFFWITVLKRPYSNEYKDIT